MKYITKRIKKAELTLYILSNFPEIDINRKRPMMIICPGGGYHFCSSREAEPIAIKFLSLGYNAAVLMYTTEDKFKTKKKLYPLPLRQLAKTVEYIRKHAEKLNTDPDKICTIGFSAGAHLVGSLGCFWEEYGEASKPNAQVLCYPVISSGKFAHRGSFENLCGDDKELTEKMSLENSANSQVPPTFIWTTKTDQSVPCQNSELFESALKKENVPVKTHYFATGEHGLSLATKEVHSKKHPESNQEVAAWPMMVHEWLCEQFGVDYTK